MRFSLLGVVLTILFVNSNSFALELLKPSQWKLSELGKLIFPEIARKFGYSAETRDVVTEDGYILRLFHILGDRTRVVLLVHGNTAAAEYWIDRGESSMALTLARQGYDVWAINLRGSRHSRRHIHLDADKQPRRFFNFSIYEQGIYDLPATIDFILQETSQQQLVAVGQSVGTTLIYVMGAEKPEYNDKIKVGISLSPICFLDHLRGYASLAGLAGPILDLLDLLNIQEIVGYDKVSPFFHALCLQPLGYEFCVKIGLFGILGYDTKGLEPDLVPTLFGHFPAGASLKTFQHLYQVIKRKDFVKFDYGKKKNLMLYNSPRPPPFDLSKVTMKMALFMGREDFLGTVQDSVRLNASLPNVVHYQVLPYKKFNHGDFMWGRYMNDNLYPYVLPVIEKYI